MGKIKSVKLAKRFKDIANFKNFRYYDGERKLDEVLAEIKLLIAEGVKHFIVDSVMKIDVPNAKSRFEANSIIGNEFSKICVQYNVNIYLIAQVSQDTEKNRDLAIKHGNDIEYDADYIFYIIKKPKIANGKVVKDLESGSIEYDDNARRYICVKNRIDDRLFKVDIDKSDIMGTSEPVEVVFEPKVEVPTI
jgi:hypothetical protein